MRTTKIIMRIATVVAFSVAIATFATKPAQANFGMALGYKYVSVPSAQYNAHVPQLDFMWTIGGGGKGYRAGGKRPYHALGFGLALGGSSHDVSGGSLGNWYIGLPLIYEYVFASGWGISGGVTIPFMLQNLPPTMESDPIFGFLRVLLFLPTLGLSTLGLFEGIGGGIGVSDLGVNYHFNNGLTLYARTNIGYVDFARNVGSNSGANGVIWGAGGGLGYWF